MLKLSSVSKPRQSAMPGRKTEKSTCELCYDTLEKGQDILKCNGECGCVVHRYCAGVTKRHYESLGKGHKPFVCQWCSMLTSKAVIEQLQSEVAVLQTELAAAKVALAKQNEQAALASASSPASYAAAAASQVSDQGRRQPQRNRHKPQRRGKPIANAAISHSTATLTGTSSATSSTNPSQTAQQHARVRVEGARRIWGTHPHATTRTVANAIERFCKVDLQGLRVKRKTTRNAYSRKTSWWFVVHAEEVVLRDLEDKWDVLNTQTSWVLKPCFKPADSEDSTSSSADAGQPMSSEIPILDTQQTSSIAATPNLEPPHPSTSNRPSNHDNSPHNEPAAEGEPSNLENPVAGWKTLQHAPTTYRLVSVIICVYFTIMLGVSYPNLTIF